MRASAVSQPLRTVIVGALALACLAFSPSASAQMGLTFGGGPPAADAVGLVVGGFEGLTVERAETVLDLREVHLRKVVPCETTYTLLNPGAARDLEVLATSGVRTDSDPVAELDGAALATCAPAYFPRGFRWPTRRDVPTPPGLDPVEYRQHHESACVLRFSLPPGTHRLRIRQRTSLQATESGDRTLGDYQFIYGLEPARQWTGLRELSFRVLVRSGWPSASSPSVARGGDGLSARWSTVPADSIAVSVRTPRPSLWLARSFPWALLFAALAAVIAGAFALGRRLSLSGRRWRFALLALPVAFVLPGAGYKLGDRLATALITRQLGFAPRIDILSTFGDVLVVGFGGAVGVVAFLLASFAAHRRR